MNSYIGSERDVILCVYMLADGHFWGLWIWAKRVLKEPFMETYIKWDLNDSPLSLST